MRSADPGGGRETAWLGRVRTSRSLCSNDDSRTYWGQLFSLLSRSRLSESLPKETRRCLWNDLRITFIITCVCMRQCRNFCQAVWREKGAEVCSLLAGGGEMDIRDRPQRAVVKADRRETATMAEGRAPVVIQPVYGWCGVSRRCGAQGQTGPSAMVREGQARSAQQCAGNESGWRAGRRKVDLARGIFRTQAKEEDRLEPRGCETER